MALMGPAEDTAKEARLLASLGVSAAPAPTEEVEEEEEKDEEDEESPNASKLPEAAAEEEDAVVEIEGAEKPSLMPLLPNPPPDRPAPPPSFSFHRSSTYFCLINSRIFVPSVPLGAVPSLGPHLAKYKALCAVLPPLAIFSTSSSVNLLIEIPLMTNCSSRRIPEHFVHTKVLCVRFTYPGIFSGQSAHDLLPSIFVSLRSANSIFS